MTTTDSTARRNALARACDTRTIRRLTPVSRFYENPDPAPLRTGVVLDVETTGLDHRQDRIIELACQRFAWDEAGRIVEVDPPRVWREDPGVELDPRITRLTGLTRADLIGQAIAETEASSLIGAADWVIAHNAGFDRPFVDRRLPAVAGQAWACTMAEIDWLGHGFDGRSLGHLLYQMGWFYEGHRAENDVLALLHLLAHELPDGATVLAKLLAASNTPGLRVDALGAPFETKDRLKARGYRWNAARRFWSKEIAEEAVEEERAWLEADIYAESYAEPVLTRISACERYRNEDIRA